MDTFTTKAGVRIFYKDWGTGQPIVFHHGWPLSADDWDAQMLFFVDHGYRVIAHDRRGHGRSTQTPDGNDMDTYAADVAELAAALNLRNAVHIGHSTGGGEVARYVARHGQPQGRVAKAVLISSVPPIMVRSASNPGGTPLEAFDGFRAALAANRAQFYRDVASGPFFGFNRSGAKVSGGLIDNWWRQGMMGGAKAQYDCIKAFSETDFSDDLRGIDVPVLVMHGTDDQIVPYADAGPLSAKLLKNGQLHSYDGFPHMLIAAYLTGAFCVAATGAWYRLRGRYAAEAGVMLRMGLFMAALLIPVQLLFGHLNGDYVHDRQPTKFAAIEARWRDEQPAAEVLVAIPDARAEANRLELKVPYLGSLVASMTLKSREVGLTDFPAADRPPVAIPFFAFRAMVGCGLLMMAIAWLGSLLEILGRLDRQRWLLWATFLGFPLPFVATLTGWFTAEVGRQPWTVFGLMRTARAVSPILFGLARKEDHRRGMLSAIAPVWDGNETWLVLAGN